MRAAVWFVLVIAFLALLSPPTSVSADVEGRIKKLEDELTTIKETSKAILHRLESSIFDNFPAKLSAGVQSLYDTLVHHGGKTAATVQKEYPKWLSHAHGYTKDLPSHAQKLSATAQKEGMKHYGQATRVLSTFLTQQGVPQQYVAYLTMGVIALVLLAAALITLTILSSVLTAICCCGGRKRPSAQKKKLDKKAEAQHQQHIKNLEKPLPRT